MRGTVLISLCLMVVFSGAPSQGGAGAQGSVTDVAMAPADVIELDLQGIGWALVRITATEALNLSFSLTHDTIEDLCIFSDEGDGIYDQGHVTGFFLWDPDTFVWGNEWFWWHGTPFWSVWPSQTGDCGASEELVLDGGDTVHFAIADTTGGYTATLEASGGAGDAQTLAIPLAPHPGFVRIDPEPSVTSVYSGEGLQVLRERAWVAPLTLTENVVTISDWDHENGSFATVAWEDTEIAPAGTASGSPFASIPFAEWGMGGGESRSTTGVHWHDPGDFDARYTKADITVAPAAGYVDGAYVVSYPLVA